MCPPSSAPAAPRAVSFAAAIFLGRCKRCKVRRRVHAPVHEVRTRHLGYGRTERVYTRTIGGQRFEGYDRIFIPCEACGTLPDGRVQSIEMKLLRGRFSERIQCNARCMASHGPACECSCGGANHGSAFG